MGKANDRLINVADKTTTCENIFYKASELVESTRNDSFKIFHNYLGIKCKIAYTMHGWVTAVTENGGIIQDWAGEFTYGDPRCRN